MQPQAPATQSPSAENASTIVKQHRRSRSIDREAMNLLYTNSLEPYLGTYRIVWDSESTYEPRTPTSPQPADLRDGVLTLSRPEHPPEWPKEPSPGDGPGRSSVVLRLFDTFLGADHTASKLTPSAFSISPSSALSPLSSSSSSASSDTTSSLSSTKALAPATRSWRFDWDASFPRLGYRFEGMDATTTWGHSLAFSDLLDDAGRPFAVLELRPAGFRKDEAEPYTILVLAKRQADRYGREGLTEAERKRLGMRDVVA